MLQLFLFNYENISLKLLSVSVLLLVSVANAFLGYIFRLLLRGHFYEILSLKLFTRQSYTNIVYYQYYVAFIYIQLCTQSVNKLYWRQ